MATKKISTWGTADLTIKEVDNGYIVSVEAGTYVFRNLKTLLKALADYYEEKAND